MLPKLTCAGRRPELSESVSGQTLEREISDLKESGSSVLSLYLDIRERKLRLSDYAMNALCGNDNVHYLLGIDDSAGGNNIQTNELALLSRPTLAATTYSTVLWTA